MTAYLKDVIGYGTHADRPAAGSAGRLYYETDTTTVFRDNGSSWDALTISGTGGLTLHTASAALSADVTLTSANTWYDGPSISLTAGAWLVVATALFDVNGANDCGARLFDGTTTYASDSHTAASATYTAAVPLSKIIVPVSTITLTLQGIQNAGNTTHLKAALRNNGVGNNATRIDAIGFS